MAESLTFNKTVAGRTRAAEYILGNQDLRSLFEARGGLASDLESIIQSGRRAEVLFQMRGNVKAEGTAATVEILQAFADVQREYVAIMAVLQAVKLDLERAATAPDTLSTVKKILQNEVPVVFRTVEVAETKKRVAVRSKSQEATRAEIRKDAAAILEVPAILQALATRKVPATRIKALCDAADALAGKLADRAAARGAGKTASKEIADAVREQRQVWGACYRILALVGEADLRVRSLLSEAKR
jgi:hypothetical protein